MSSFGALQGYHTSRIKLAKKESATKSHGGARKGAGRPKNASKNLPLSVTRSFSMPEPSALKLDAKHGKKPLGQWLIARLGL